VHRFVSQLCARRVQRTMEHERRRASLIELLIDANESWHGVKLNEPDWGDDSFSLALHAELPHDGMFIHLILNAYWEPLEFELPKLDAGPWRRWIDTALDSPNDIVSWETASSVPGETYRTEARSVVLLFADAGRGVQGATEL
jgi:glycogen operon protein